MIDSMIPIYKPIIAETAKQYVNECLESSWISSKGKYVKMFEDRFSLKTDIKYATSCCNGTSALHLSLAALGIGEGDEVIVPTFTYIASVNAIRYTGATPVFVDCLKDTWQIDPDDVKKKITSKTKAIMVVHLYGHPADMSEIQYMAHNRKRPLFIIEDCAEAFGSKYLNKHVGQFGDIAAYSFFGNKTITTGEGGMVVTNNESLHNRVEKLKGQGLAKGRQYWHDVLGYNYRMTNIQAAIGCSQLEISDTVLKTKRSIAQQYIGHFENSPISWHREAPNVQHSYWMFSVTMDINEEQRNKMMEILLKDKKIETRPLFYPIHTMPMYSHKYESHCVSEVLHRTGFNIPSFPELKFEQIEHIADSIKEIYNEIHR